MNSPEFWWIILMAFFGGMWLGQKIERTSWFTRANGSTPHCVNGKFFYIVSEAKWFDVIRRVKSSKED